jgi:hypothetical protein
VLCEFLYDSMYLAFFTLSYRVSLVFKGYCTAIYGELHKQAKASNKRSQKNGELRHAFITVLIENDIRITGEFTSVGNSLSRLSHF